MVGQGKGNIKLNLAKLTGKYLDAPYRLGGHSVKEGLDCLSLILGIADDLKIDLPENFEGVDRNTYADLWQADPKKAKEIFLRFILSLGETLPVERAFAGDLLIIRPRKGNVQVGMHAGGDLVFSAFTDRGVALASIRAFGVLKAVRWMKKGRRHKGTEAEVEER